MSKVPNCVMLKRNIFLVRTSSGFTKALEIFIGEKAEKPTRIYYPPTAFPVVATLWHGYDGGNYIGCSWLHVKALQGIIDLDIEHKKQLNEYYGKDYNGK